MGKWSRADLQITGRADTWRKREGRKVVWEVLNCSIERKVWLGFGGVLKLKVSIGGLLRHAGMTPCYSIRLTPTMLSCCAGDVL